MMETFDGKRKNNKREAIYTLMCTYLYIRACDGGVLLLYHIIRPTHIIRARRG